MLIKNNPNLSQPPSITNSNILSSKIELIARIEMSKEIIFMEEKYEKIRQKLQNKINNRELNEEEIQEIGNIINVIAMKYSQEGKHTIAQQWLKKALKYAQASPRVRISTFNNLACVYKQAYDLPMALLYIKKAQKQADYLCFEVQDDKLLGIVTDCSLNLCAIQSAMGDHYKALRAVRKTLTLLKTNKQLPQSYFNSLYPLAKYNEGVELEMLKMYREAQESYQEALSNPGISEQLAQRVKRAIQQMQTMNKKLRFYETSFQKTSRRFKLSLPKFCQKYQDENERKISKVEIKAVSRKKSLAFQIKLKENSSHKQSCTTSRSNLKASKIQIENYYSNNAAGRIRKNILQSIENC